MNTFTSYHTAYTSSPQGIHTSFTPPSTDLREQIIQKYNNQLSRIQANEESKDIEELEDIAELHEINTKDLDFVQSIIRIKKEIAGMKKEQGIVSEAIKTRQSYMNQLKTLQGDIVLMQHKYQDLYNMIPHPERNPHVYDELSDPQLQTIQTIIQEQTEKCKEYETRLNNNTEKITLLQKTFSFEGQTNLLCVICYEKPIEYCIDRCGHSFCKECTDKITDKCHCCRGNVIQKIKLHYT